MDQYNRLFSCHRIPGKERDRLITISSKPNEHVIIAYQNQFFVLDVLMNSKRLNEEDIFLSLKQIIQFSEENGDEVGLFTTLPRPVWSDIRIELMKGRYSIKKY